MTDGSFEVLLNGAVVTAAWWGGAALAFWRRRWMLVAGMFGAGAAAVVFTLTSAGIDPPAWVTYTASLIRTPVAVLLVGSFVVNQPRREARPRRWRP